jgi:hypothetical protein
MWTNLVGTRTYLCVLNPMSVINVIIHTLESQIHVETGLNIPCRVRKLAGGVANDELYEKGGLCLWEYVGSYSRNVPRSVTRGKKNHTAAYLGRFGLVQPKHTFSEAGQLIFVIECDVMFGDELRFGLFKILEYSKYKVFNMALLHIYILNSV